MHTHSRVYIHTRISELYTIFNTLYYYLIPLSLVFYPSPSMTGLILSPSLCLGVASRRVVVVVVVRFSYPSFSSRTLSARRRRAWRARRLASPKYK